jgi:hypothetical protein
MVKLLFCPVIRKGHRPVWRRRASALIGSAGERPPASPPNSAADDSSHMWGATPCIKIGSASRLDVPTKVGAVILPSIWLLKESAQRVSV